MTENKEKNISVYAEASPNPESMKLVLNQTVLPDGVSVDYPNVEAAANSPLDVPPRWRAYARTPCLRRVGLRPYDPEQASGGQGYPPWTRAL